MGQLWILKILFSREQLRDWYELSVLCFEEVRREEKKIQEGKVCGKLCQVLSEVIWKCDKTSDYLRKTKTWICAILTLHSHLSTTTEWISGVELFELPWHPYTYPLWVTATSELVHKEWLQIFDQKTKNKKIKESLKLWCQCSFALLQFFRRKSRARLDLKLCQTWQIFPNNSSPIITNNSSPIIHQ